MARNKYLSVSADREARTCIWDCTAGRFNWFYDTDETVYVIEGSVIIKDRSGGVTTLGAGDTAFFPAGSSAEWTVERYVRKVAFMRSALPLDVQFARRVSKAVRRRLGQKEAPPAL